MDSTSILFRTTRGDILPTHANYKELDNLELEALLHSIRDASASLEAELQRRQGSTTAVLPDLFKDYGNKLDATVRVIRHLNRLESRQARLVESAASFLKAEPTTHSARVYREFLIDVTRLCGRGLALLCAASLGKNKVATLTTQMRASFVGYVQSRKEFLDTPILGTLAEQYELPKSGMFPYFQHIQQLTIRPNTVVKTQERPEQHPLAEDHPTTTGELRVEATSEQPSMLQTNRRRFSPRCQELTLIRTTLRNPIHVLQSAHRPNNAPRRPSVRCSPD